MMSTAKLDFETRIPEKLPALARKGVPGPKSLLVIRVTGDDGGTWTVDLRDAFEVRSGGAEGADCTIEMSPDTWNAVSEDPAQMTALYVKGDIRVTGNPMHGMKLRALLE